MAQIITMPKLGLTMTEGVISKWCKLEGEEVKVGDALFEVSTDKITNQVEAETEGVLKKVFVKEGDSAPVTAPVAVIAAKDEDISKILKEAGTPVSDIPAEQNNDAAEKIEIDVSADKKGSVKASPAAKKMAKDNKIDLSLIKGTGPDGRIVEKDVKAFMEDLNRKVKVSPAAGRIAEDLGVDINSINKDSRVMKEDVLTVSRLKAAAVETKEDKRITPSPMRRVIAERMSISWSTSPRVTFNMEADVTKMKEFRESLKKECENEGVKLSFNHILIKICAKALAEFPYVNGSYDGKEIILHNRVNVGLAVAVEGGLVVPNVKKAEAKSLLEIAKDTERLIDASRKGALKIDEMTGGTFTITNLGMFGMESFSPIINQPELAILGVNAIIEKPVVKDGQIVIRPMMNLSLTADHRVVDGVEAARFLSRIRQLIENPYLLLL